MRAIWVLLAAACFWVMCQCGTDSFNSYGGGSGGGGSVD